MGVRGVGDSCKQLMNWPANSFKGNDKNVIGIYFPVSGYTNMSSHLQMSECESY